MKTAQEIRARIADMKVERQAVLDHLSATGGVVTKDTSTHLIQMAAAVANLLWVLEK